MISMLHMVSGGKPILFRRFTAQSFHKLPGLRIVGEYVGRICTETKQQPRYITSAKTATNKELYDEKK